MPPDFNKLPKPGEESVKSTKDIESDQSNIENLLKKSKIEDVIKFVKKEHVQLKKYYKIRGHKIVT